MTKTVIRTWVLTTVFAYVRGASPMPGARLRAQRELEPDKDVDWSLYPAWMRPRDSGDEEEEEDDDEDDDDEEEEEEECVS